MIMETVTEYQRLFNSPENAEKWIKIFWSISEFPAYFLFAALQEVSGAEFDDDYLEFLKNNNLMMAGLAIIGVNSPSDVEKVIEENSGVTDRLTHIVRLFSPPAKGYLLDIQQQFEKDYPAAFFPYLLATVANLLVRSKNYLAKWSKEFARIVEKHPAPKESIMNVLSIAFRGEALVVDNYGASHRNFNACSKLFIDLVDDDTGKAKNLIWMKKYTRILDALGEE